ncbi:hypothetical protein [Kineococcus sp. SYSU DK006]|uniref:hypothetical protein n=1 Tax=Kineococcus sp. SYSU DK006 TaxID=3383127 RepID=UPI003D7EE3C8
MTGLLRRLLGAHGGADAWRRTRTISVHHRFRGALWELKDTEGLLEDARTTVRVQQQWSRQSPFGPLGYESTVTPDLVLIETGDDEDEVVEELQDPRASFAGHVLSTPWTPAQLAYFTGYTMWACLTEPWSLTFPGVRTEEVGPWVEGGKTWQRLRVVHPGGTATHSPVQTLYVDADGMLRRRDYEVDIAGSFPSVHYASGFEEHGGLVLATHHEVFPRSGDGHPVTAPVVVSIDLDRIQVDSMPPRAAPSAEASPPRRSSPRPASDRSSRAARRPRQRTR